MGGTLYLDGRDQKLIAAGLRLLFQRMRQDGLVPPRHLVELQADLSEDDTNRHEGPEVETGELGSDHQYMTPREVAVLLRVSERTIARHVKDGTIPSFMVGRRRRFRRSDIEALVSG